MNIYKIVKMILQITPFIWLIIFIDPSLYKNFWDYSWKILVILLFIRPIRDIFPEYKFFLKAVSLRKELWIISGVFALVHVVWYFLSHNLSFWFLFDSIMWNYKWYLWWWMYAFVIAMILTITSNNFSIKKLWKHWKKFQKLAYLMLLFVAIHIALVNKDALVSVIITVTSYIMIYFLAFLYKKI